MLGDEEFLVNKSLKTGVPVPEDVWVARVPEAERTKMSLGELCQLAVDNAKRAGQIMQEDYDGNVEKPWNPKSSGGSHDATVVHDFPQIKAILSPQARDQFPQLVEEYQRKCREMDTLFDAWRSSWKRQRRDRASGEDL